jgi:hypothetical protein
MKSWTLAKPIVLSLALCSLAAPTFAQSVTGPAQLNTDLERDLAPVHVVETHDGLIYASDLSGTYVFTSWFEYSGSDFFRNNDMRCGTAPPMSDGKIQAGTGDCSSSFNNPLPEYAPSVAHYRIPVVVHVMTHKNGSGNISDALILSQIDILNEDFQALAGSNGQNGIDVEIEFFLATTDPNGNPTNGITRSQNVKWYNDSGNYWSSLAWDTNRYLNIYTNTASGNLGYAYVPNGGGVVGNIADRVVILWSSFGANAPIGPPYNLGRTTTHEVGHYLGLYHTFQGGCASASGCQSNGDLICDTNPESGPNYSPCSRSTCGSPDPTDNYLDYSDDICMQRFTSDQARRMRCTLENFRVDLADDGGTNPTLPGKAGSPSPSHGASGASTSSSLSWSAGSGATSYDVYFGTDSTPDAGELQGNQGGTSFNPGSLANSSTYYWRVDSVNTAGTTTGDVWSFTTVALGGGGLTLSVNGYKVKGKWTVDLSWSGAAGGTLEIYRNGSLLTTTANDGAYTDATSFKGGGSLSYQVCEPGGACSNSATASF